MSTKLIAQNRRARHDFTILEKIEAGMALNGGEVKSIKAGEISLNEAFVTIRDNEAWLLNAFVKPYQNQQGEPTRSRKLLLHRNELAKLIGASRETSRTLIPLRVYLSRGLIKLEIALAQGKKQHDKRQALKAKEQKREAERAVKESLR